MTVIRSCSIAVGVFAVAAFATQAAAQATQSGILTNLEVRQLITRGEPADHARLRGHFTALANQYEADAKQHNAMARAFLLNPGRRVAANRSSDHCKRLEDLATQSAATVRELAVHHGRRSGDPAAHCDRLVRISREAAKEAGAVAAEHKQAADATK